MYHAFVVEHERPGALLKHGLNPDLRDGVVTNSQPSAARTIHGINGVVVVSNIAIS